MKVGNFMGKEVFEKYESNVRSYCRKWPVEFSFAKGSIIVEDNGKQYIDFFNGAGALNYGHNNDFIKEKLVKYIESDAIIHSLDMYASAKKELIEYLEENILIPRSLDYKVMFPNPTGTNAIEMALKLARKNKKRSNIFAFMGAFHGMTLGSLALTTEKAAREGAGITLNNVTHIAPPYYMNGKFDTLGYLNEILNDDHSGIEKPAAIILETVQAEGGIYAFDVDFLRGLRKLCDEQDILLIVDDIQVGCARTGTFFSFERAGIVPDMVVLSKSIGGYGLPLSMVLIKPELDIFSPGEHNGTFRGFQLSMVTAKAGLEFMLKNNIEAEVKRKEAIVKDYLDKNIKPLLKDNMSIRGIGLIWGIDFNDGKLSRAVLDKCFEKGLIIELAGRNDGVLKIMPALTIEDDLLIKGLDIVKDSIKECL
jgi:diaminobutyrate-2-oxoglutarate transaminase